MAQEIKKMLQSECIRWAEAVNDEYLTLLALSHRSKERIMHGDIKGRQESELLKHGDTELLRYKLDF